MFLEDKSANAEIFQILHDDELSPMSQTGQSMDNQEVRRWYSLGYFFSRGYGVTILQQI